MIENNQCLLENKHVRNNLILISEFCRIIEELILIA